MGRSGKLWRMQATMADESVPPDRQAPSETSLTICRWVVRMSVSCTFSTQSDNRTEGSGWYSSLNHCRCWAWPAWYSR